MEVDVLYWLEENGKFPIRADCWIDGELQANILAEAFPSAAQLTVRFVWTYLKEVPKEEWPDEVRIRTAQPVSQVSRQIVTSMLRQGMKLPQLVVHLYGVRVSESLWTPGLLAKHCGDESQSN